MFRKLFNLIFGTKHTGVIDLTPATIPVLDVKYLQKNEDGSIVERIAKLPGTYTPEQIQKTKLELQSRIENFVSWVATPGGKVGKPYVTSIRAVNVIKSWEGCKLESYDDGGGVWTIGWGTTAGVKPGMTITMDQAEKYLMDYIRQQDKELNKLLADVELVSQNQYDAISSFVYNIGSVQFAKSTFLKFLKESSWDKAANQLVRRDSKGIYHGWIYDNGKKVQGLINRRKAEKMLFLRPIS